MPLLSNILDTAQKAVKRLASALYPSLAGQETQTSSSQTSQDEGHSPDTKRRRTNENSFNSSNSMTVSTSGEIISSPLLNLPGELWVKIFNLTQKPSKASLAEQSTQSANNIPMLPPNVRGVSKRFKAIYDATLYRRFLSTFKPTIYDDSQYQLLVNQIGEPNNGQVHLSLENGFLKYHLRTLDGRSMEGMLNIELSSQLSEQAVFNHKDDIHHELSAAIQIHEVKMRLIAEMDELLSHEEAILANISTLEPFLKECFTRLKALRQGGLYQIFNFLESEYHLERINTLIVQEKIYDEYCSPQIQGLRSLNCTSCGLTRFPKTIFFRKNYATFWAKLNMLILDNNRLQSLPAEIGLLKKLRFLFADNNELQSVPREVGQLVELERLSLRGNQLQSLPAEMAALHNLKLFVENNRFQSLPDSLGDNIFWSCIQTPEGPIWTTIGKVATLGLQQPIDENELEMMAPGM